MIQSAKNIQIVAYIMQFIFICAHFLRDMGRSVNHIAVVILVPIEVKKYKISKFE